MAGYQRQAAADIIPTNIIKSGPLNAEYNALRDAFHAVDGHRHDGSVGEGGFIPLIADFDGMNRVEVDIYTNTVKFLIEVGGVATEQFSVKDGAIVPSATNDVDLGSAVAHFKNAFLTGNLAVATINATGNIMPTADNAQDIGSAALSWRNAYIDGTATINSAVITTADIDGGNIDGTVIGNTTPTTVKGTTVTATTGFVGNVTGNVTGNLTGNVTGNVTGDLTGNVTASTGTTTLNDVKITGTLNMDAGTTGTIQNLSTPINAADAATKAYVDLHVEKSGDTMSGDLAMGANKVTSTATPITDDTLTRKGYVDTQDALKVAKAGDTMTGNLAMGTNAVTSTVDPSADTHLARKKYVDDKDALKVAKAGDTMTGTLTMSGVGVTVTGIPTPVLDADAANKKYVDDGIAALVDSSPAALDTLNELAAAINDDANFSTTITNSIATKLPLAGGTMSGNIDMATNTVTGLGTPTLDSDAATKGYVDSNTVASAGDTMTGTLAMGANKVTTTADPVADDDLARKGYVDANDALNLNLTGGTMTGSITMSNSSTVTGLVAPSVDSDATTKLYVDTADNLKLDKAGGTVTGTINMGANKITTSYTPVDTTDLVNKTYVDTTFVNVSGDTMTGNLVMGANAVTTTADPTDDTHLARKAYVDSILGSSIAAAISAGEALSSANAAAASATAASISAANAEAAYDSFDDRYLGSKTSDPTLDNDGNSLVTGAMYFNSANRVMRVYNGAEWQDLSAFVQTQAVTLTNTILNENSYVSTDDEFGHSVSVAGDYIVVGVPYEESTAGSNGSGVVYVYNRTTGNLLHTIQNPNAYSTEVGDYFGFSVATDGTNFIVGTSQEDYAAFGPWGSMPVTDTGYAYMFDCATGTLQQTWRNPNVTIGYIENFGYSVAIDGDYAVVGTPRESSSSTDSGKGAAYIYSVVTGALVATLTGSGVVGANFGTACAIRNGYVAVGEPGQNKAYVFDTTGALLYTLDNPNLDGFDTIDAFGGDITLTSDYVLVTAVYADPAGTTNSGIVYVFDVHTGALLRHIKNPNVFGTANEDEFGHKITAYGNIVAISSVKEGANAELDFSGAVYVFHIPSGTLLCTIANPNAYLQPEGDYFGYSLSLYGNVLVVGATGESPSVPDDKFGVVYVYEIPTALSTLTYNGQITTNSLQVNGQATTNSLLVNYEVTTNSLQVNDQHFPYFDGEYGQTLITDGAGNISWGKRVAFFAQANAPTYAEGARDGDLWRDTDDGVIYLATVIGENVQWFAV